MAAGATRVLSTSPDQVKAGLLVTLPLEKMPQLAVRIRPELEREFVEPREHRQQVGLRLC